ncbi:MAG: hypothetical protein E6R13_08320 [Spirochaetes bacterium]|nr:MAG: hypothetical protein E6R13_08320 [Spirochaetota bacterium]
MYKQRLTKSKYKNKMRMFWTEKWHYELGVDMWTDIITGKVLWTGGGGAFGQRKANELMFGAIEKLILEKKLKKEEADSLRNMLRSADPENVYMAISVISRLKPKKFKQPKNVGCVEELS